MNLTSKRGPIETCPSGFHPGALVNTYIEEFNRCGRYAVCCGKCNHKIRWAEPHETTDMKDLIQEILNG